MPGMCADSSSGREVSRRVHFLALSLWRLEQIVRSGRDPFFSVNGEAGYLHSGPFPSGVPSEIPMEIFREKAVRVLDKAKRQGIMMIAIDEPAYPEILLRLPDPPLVLFFRGVLPGRPGIAMVGTRRPTVEARRGFESLAAGLSRFGLPIVSGLAAGLDAAAHRGALLGKGTTVAVVGTGLDRVYPDFHRTLAGEILSGGAASSPNSLREVRPTAGIFPSGTGLSSVFRQVLSLAPTGGRPGLPSPCGAPWGRVGMWLSMTGGASGRRRRVPKLFWNRGPDAYRRPKT